VRRDCADELRPALADLPPGPIASQDWFVENLRQVFDVVPAQKIVVGIANYAYDWSDATGKEHEAAAEFSIQEACYTPRNPMRTSSLTALR